MQKYKIIGILCTLFFFTNILSAQIEICDNGIDDDNDGFVDINDPDCVCVVIEPVSLIPNPSFEDLECCPSNRSQLNCASDWIQASEPTTDLIHQCGWFGWDEFPPPEPFPDGEGIMGFRDGRIRNSTGTYEPNWKEYAGACLISPLEEGVSYRLEFDLGFVDPSSSPPINLSFFGTTNCDNLPFGIGDEDFGCPSNSSQWTKLTDVFIGGGSTNTWVNSFFEITPDRNITAIAIGPDCSPNPSGISTFYFFDNLVLADLESFELQIEQTGHACSPDFGLSVIENAGLEYQWYKAGVAIPGETTSSLSGEYGPGIYRVRVVDGGSCRLSETFVYTIPTFNTIAPISICEEETYQFGTETLSEPGSYEATFKSINNCDSIVSLELQIIGSQRNTDEVSILAGDIYEAGDNQLSEPGEYDLVFESSLGCDSLVLLTLNNFEVFIPNAFSPNFDGINDYFQPFSESGRMTSVEIEVFDRWGGLRFRGDRWDGSDLNPGVYIYVMNIVFDYGAEKQYGGSITLLR